MDVTKAKAAVETLRKEIQNVFNATVESIRKGDNSGAAGLVQLGKADTYIEKVVARLDSAVERTAPKERKEKTKGANGKGK